MKSPPSRKKAVEGRVPEALATSHLEPPCEPAKCPPRRRNWHLPAGVLNSLWCDFFPRLVAVSWHDGTGCGTPYLNTTDPKPLGRGMDAAGILALLKWLEARMAAATPLRVDAATGQPAPCAVQGRLAEVIRHLEDHQSRTGRPFPVLIAGTGGYDFLLSDWGIELFMPDPPAGNTKTEMAVDLLRYYSFRQSGRPSLGIPSYMTDAMSLLSVDAPTGPSQVLVDPVETFIALGLSPACPEANRLLDRWDVSGSARSIIAQALGSQAERTGKTKGGRVGQPVRMNFDEYVCAMRPFRCWQVEGTVYRGIAAELPRLVAEAWMPPVEGLPPYKSRFADGGDYGLRGLFRERLETQLPDAGHMRFEVQSSPAPSAPTWNADDVMITNQGLFFPPLGKRPNLCDMLTQIADGRAGNPVFTDSKRPDREG